MWAFPLAVGISLVVAAVILWGVGPWISTARMNLAITAGTSAGIIGWHSVNEFTAAGEGSGWRSAIRSSVTTVIYPSEAGNWVCLILWISFLCTVALVLVRRRKAETHTTGYVTIDWGTLFAWGAISTAALLRLLWGSVYLTRRWNVGMATLTIAGHVAFFVFVMAISHRTEGQRFGACRLILMTTTAVSACLVMAMSGSAVYAQLLATGVVSLLMCCVMAWTNRKPVTHEMWPVGMLLMVVSLYLWLGHFYAELTLVNIALLWGSMLAGAVYGAGGDSVPAWWSKILPGLVCVSFSVSAIGNAGVTLSRTLSNQSW